MHSRMQFVNEAASAMDTLDQEMLTVDCCYRRVLYRKIKQLVGAQASRWASHPGHIHSGSPDFMAECYQLLLRARIQQSQHEASLQEMARVYVPRVELACAAVEAYLRASIREQDAGERGRARVWCRLMSILWSQFLSQKHHIMSRIRKGNFEALQSSVVDLFLEDDSASAGSSDSAPQFQSDQEQDHRPRKIYSRLGLKDMLSEDRIQAMQERIEQMPESKIRANLLSHLHGVFGSDRDKKQQNDETECKIQQ